MFAELNTIPYLLCPLGKSIYFLNHYSNPTFASSCNWTYWSEGEKLRIKVTISQ